MRELKHEGENNDFADIDKLQTADLQYDAFKLALVVVPCEYVKR